MKSTMLAMIAAMLTAAVLSGCYVDLDRHGGGGHHNHERGQLLDRDNDGDMH